MDNYDIESKDNEKNCIYMKQISFPLRRQSGSVKC